MTKFSDVVSGIERIGLDWHEGTILKNTIKNASKATKSIAELQGKNGVSNQHAIVISAGPSLHHNNSLLQIVESNYNGTIIAIDGSYVKCLKRGIIPDYVLTLDPHPTRIVRWFGDPEFRKNMEGDDYFSRQDLDIDFRNNSFKENEENIRLVNKFAPRTKLVIATTAPENLVNRTIEAKFDSYWWLPLVDNPSDESSLTKKMYQTVKLPALNTGGNVGTAAWVFAQFWLEINRIAVIGMDLGYKKDLPVEMTQSYYELSDMYGKENIIRDLFPESIYPQTGEIFYTDPTYYWYKENLLELIANSKSTLYNCTEGGTLYGEGIICMSLNQYIEETSG